MNGTLRGYCAHPISVGVTSLLGDLMSPTPWSLTKQTTGSAQAVHTYVRNQKRPRILLLQQIVEEPAPFSIDRGIQTNTLGQWSTASRSRFLELPNSAPNCVHNRIGNNKTLPHNGHIPLFLEAPMYTCTMSGGNCSGGVGGWSTNLILSCFMARALVIAQYSFSALLWVAGARPRNTVDKTMNRTTKQVDKSAKTLRFRIPLS
jgi:hypothetical protein